MTSDLPVCRSKTSTTWSPCDRGSVVHQMLSRYQMRELGGEGYLRLLELLPDGRTLVVRS